MTPSERLLKAVHAAIDQERDWLNALPSRTHAIRITVKPRPDEWRVSMSVEKQEEGT